MELKDFLAYLNSGKTVIAGSEMHQYMCMLSQEALKLTAELNNSYHMVLCQDLVQVKMRFSPS